ncbi:titin-like isoform X1 [Pygocentrus nattereri]|uniref:titin-like isoform X1 n=1 Tax=Pygocentrus nattereri TaxID=42514 RepID=UPI0018911293|nr:titin-like isoform X1 [Pygocentrus nattereri]
MEFRSLSVILLLTVLIHSGQTARPKATVTIHPADPVFTGETVTLTCHIGSGDGWYYEWFKDGKSLSEAQQGKEYTISKVAESNGGVYTCKGRQSTQPSYSDTSDAVTLTVSDLPKPTLTVEPERPVFSGESVTLKCEIKGYDGWTYQWYKLDPWRRWTAVSQSVYYNVNRDTLTIRGDTVINGDQYLCRGERHDRLTSSEYSSSVTLTVKALPTAELTVEPKWSPVFSGESVTLKCEIKGYDGWTYQWYKQDKQSGLTAVSQSEYHTVNRDTLTIRADTVINGEQYWCRGERRDRPTSSQYSSSVTLTVNETPKPAVSIQPDDQVFRGETVTLRCDIQGGGVSNWQYSWFKDGSSTPVRNEQQYRISSVTASDRGTYTCRGTERGTSRYSHTSDPVTLTVSERPKPAVSIQPDDQVFSGETVTLRCDIQGGGVSNWQYSWFKAGSSTAVSNEQQYSISPVTASDRGTYTCIGAVSGTSRNSHTSDAATLTVSERPKPAVSIQPDHQVFRGETVTLRCEIKGGGVSNWQYSWFKDGSSTPVSYKQQYSISSVTASDGGTYTCRGAVRGTSRYSHYSEAVTLTVSGKPKPTVRADPRSSVYTGDTVTLTCEVKSTGWEFLWYKDSQPLQPQSPVDKGTKTLSVTVSHAGTAEFRCAARRGAYTTQTSAPAVITVTARPKATVTIHQADPVFIGETVTLTCDIGSRHHWQYDWFKDSNPLSEAQWRKEYTISNVAASHRGVYTCNGRRSTQPRYSETSDAVTLTVSGKPTPTVRVDPQSSVYTGDTVTLTCEVESTGWEFLWYKDSQPLQPQSPVGKETNTVRVTVSDKGRTEFKCAARRKNYFDYSYQRYDGYDYDNSKKRHVYYNVYNTHRSAPAMITVTARPKATVTIHPADPVFIGETVTLTCDIGSGHHWQYYWFKNSKPLSEAQQRNEYTISNVAASHRGVYTCKGRQSTQPRYSETSDAVTLTVSETPKPELTSSHKGAAPIGNPVVLYCKLDQSAGWRFYWSKHTQSPENETKTETHSYTISSVSVSDGGQYWCRAGRGTPVYYTHYSDALWINVTDGSVILDSPVHSVTEGDPLTLRCLYRDPKPSNLTAEFYKDGSLLQTQTTGEMTIRTVSKSDEGLYHCKHPEKGESPQSWISVRGASFSVFSLLSSLMAVSPYLLVTIVLGVKCYRAQGENSQSSCGSLITNTLRWTFQY